MRNNFKISLLSLLACVLTVGGAFGAWVFGEADYNAEPSTDITAGTTPEGFWYFEESTVTFSAASADGSFSGYWVENESQVSTKSLSIKNGSSISFDDISSIGSPMCSTDGYVFTHWTYYKQTSSNQSQLTHFNYDVGLNDTTILYANYVPNTNPALYIYDDGDVLVSYMYLNTANTEVVEYMINNIVVSEDPKQGSEGRDKYFIKYNGDNIWCDSYYDSSDHVYKGVYNVFFQPNKTVSTDNSVDNDWKTYGEKVLFQRQYNYVLLGSPNGWSVNSDSLKFGYVSEAGDNSSKTTTLRLSNVTFSDEITGNFEFKVNEPNFDLWPSQSSETTEYAVIDESTNLVLTQAATEILKFDVEIKVTYTYVTLDPDNSSKRIYNFVPSSIVVNLYPEIYTIRYFEDASGETQIGVTENVVPGVNPAYYKLSGFNNKEGENHSLYFVNSWVDIETGTTYTIDQMETLEVNKNFKFYVVYDNEATKPQTYNYYYKYDGSWSYRTVRVYDTVYDSHSTSSIYLNDVVAPNGYTYSNMWQKGSVTSSGTQYSTATISTVEYDENVGATTISYYAEFSKSNAYKRLFFSNGNLTIDITASTGNKYIYRDFGSSSNATIQNSDGLLGTNGETINKGAYADGSKNTFTGCVKYCLENTSYSSSNTKRLIWLDPDRSSGCNWATSNAWFAIHYWGGSSSSSSPQRMSAATINGATYYYYEVPLNTTYVIFLRMSNTASTPTFSFNDGLWNRTNDISISNYGNYLWYPISWDNGTWSDGHKDSKFSSTTISNFNNDSNNKVLR